MRTSLFHRMERRHIPTATRSLPRLRRGWSIQARDLRPADGPLGLEAMDAGIGRVQAAGGPVDQATYVCGCGFLFSASVSTTVACPHCGAEQDW